MADLKVQLVLSAVDRASGPLKALAARLDDFRQSAGIASLGEIGQRLKGVGIAAAGAVAGVTAIAARFTPSVIATGAEFERLGMRLEALEGSGEKAKAAMAWIREFAVKTPLEVRDVTEAYAALKNVGIDPTRGALQALTDANAKAGGSAAQLGGVILAVSQMWGKSRIATEEMNQLTERSIPVWGALATALKKPEAEVRRLVETGKLGRKEIKLLVEELGRQSAGASARFATSWEGILSNLAEHWTNFKLKIAEAGVFDTAKRMIQQLLETLDRMASNGTLQRLAELIGGALTQAMTWAAEAIEKLITQGGGVEPLTTKMIDGLTALAEPVKVLAGFLTGLAGAWDTVAAAIRPVIALTDAYWRGYEKTVGAVSRGVGAAAGWAGRQLGVLPPAPNAAPAPAPAVAAGGEFNLGGGAGLDRLGGGAPLPARAQVGGEIVVRIEGAPKGSRVEKVAPKGGIELGVELGLAMGG